MIDAIFKMYCEQKRMINHPEWATDDPEKNLIADMKLAIAILDESNPDYKNRYDRLVAMQKSFTPEQVDFICYTIGDWYCAWKERIVVDLEDGTHRLGYAKEELKMMICGD